MSDAPLDPNELEAIQEAIREARSSPSRQAAELDETVTSLALIADDRAAETARPAAMKLAEAWLPSAQRVLARYGEVELSVLGAELIDGAVLRDELAGMVVSGVTAPERAGTLLLAAGGAFIHELSARIFGAAAVVKTDPESDGDSDEESAKNAASDEQDENKDSLDKLPSTTAVRLFAPVAEKLSESLCEMWTEEDSCATSIATPLEIENARRSLVESDVVIAVTVTIEGTLRGRVRWFVKPMTLVAPPATIESVPVSPDAIAAVLGNVEVEVDVQLGSAKLTLKQLKQLRLGTIITLTRFVDDPLALRCGGVVKGFGCPVVTRGVLGVQIVGNDGKGDAA